MHSAKCVVEPPALGSAQSACVCFATEFLRDDSKAFRSSTFFDQPERLETVSAVVTAERPQDIFYRHCERHRKGSIVTMQKSSQRQLATR